LSNHDTTVNKHVTTKLKKKATDNESNPKPNLSPSIRMSKKSGEKDSDAVEKNLDNH
jgi:hypothetical protein